MDQLGSRQLPPSFAERLKSNEETLLRTLYAGSYRALELYVLRNSGSPDDAKDVYQEAFLAVWRNTQIGRFVPSDEDEFAAYLMRVAKNKWIDELRKQKNKYMVPVDERHESSVASEERGEEIDTYINTVKKQYKHLGARCRELLGRFYFRKQSLREIAAEFAWTDASAKNNKYRCLKQLRDLVIKKGEANG